MDTIDFDKLVYINNPIIVDIRNYYYYCLSHVPNAISIPYYNLLNNYSHYLNRCCRYYLYCDTGERSLEIVRRLNLFGYNTVSINGGYDEYKKRVNF